MSTLPDVPKLGDLVYYYDDDKRVYAATVSYVTPILGKEGIRPLCNLAIIKHSGYQSNKQGIAPAYHDGKLWRLIEKWSWPDEIPTECYNTSMADEGRARKFGTPQNNTIS